MNRTRKEGVDLFRCVFPTSWQKEEAEKEDEEKIEIVERVLHFLISRLEHNSVRVSINSILSSCLCLFLFLIVRVAPWSYITRRMIL
jgi:hypothetical protein